MILSQQVIGLSTEYDDSFIAWKVFSIEDEIESEGSLELTFGRLSNDWLDWSFQVGNESGNIRSKFSNDERVWELTSSESIILIERVWPNDNREWKITQNGVSKTIKTRWGNIADEWKITNEREGYFDVYTQWEGDPRDWIIESDLNEKHSTLFQLALAFIAIYNSIPKV